MNHVDEVENTWDSLKPGDIVRWWDGAGRSWYDLVIAVIIDGTIINLTFMVMWRDEGYIDADQDSIILGTFHARESMTETGCERIVAS